MMSKKPRKKSQERGSSNQISKYYGSQVLIHRDLETSVGFGKVRTVSVERRRQKSDGIVYKAWKEKREGGTMKSARG